MHQLAWNRKKNARCSRADVDASGIQGTVSLPNPRTHACEAAHPVDASVDVCVESIRKERVVVSFASGGVLRSEKLNGNKQT